MEQLVQLVLANRITAGVIGPDFARQTFRGTEDLLHRHDVRPGADGLDGEYNGTPGKGDVAETAIEDGGTTQPGHIAIAIAHPLDDIAHQCAAVALALILRQNRDFPDIRFDYFTTPDAQAFGLDDRYSDNFPFDLQNTETFRVRSRQ